MVRKIFILAVMGIVATSSLLWAYGKGYRWRRGSSGTCIGQYQQNRTDGGAYYKRFRYRRMNNATNVQ